MERKMKFSLTKYRFACICFKRKNAFERECCKWLNVCARSAMICELDNEQVASVLPLVTFASSPLNNDRERKLKRRGTRAVIRVVSYSANFTKCPFTSSTLTLSHFLFAPPVLGLFHSVSVGTARIVLAKKNNF